MNTREAFDKFKLYVSGLEYSPDTLALDKALGEASQLLYDTRHQIDIEWARARARPLLDLDVLGLTKSQAEEFASAIDTVLGLKGVSDGNG